MTFAPIALFTYSRADHTRQAIESLKKNQEAADSHLFIFSDGPKNEKAVEGVRKNREYIHSVNGFKTVTIIEREKNWGLAKSLISGITEITDKFGKVIVVEDDLVLSPFFLKYMNDGLEKYKDDDRVASISAFLNPIEGEVPESFFLRYFACWGWATWKRSWDLLNTDSRHLIKQLRWKTNEFNIGGNGPFYGILYCDKVVLNDSWAVRFYASCFLAGKLHLFPGKTMAIQTGMDGSGTHCGDNGSKNPFFGMRPSSSPVFLKDIPVEENKKMYKAFSSFYRKISEVSLSKAWYLRFKSFVRRVIGLDHK